jgi:heme/copper-type cytochrome/quinol oxidase subunit 2
MPRFIVVIAFSLLGLLVLVVPWPGVVLSGGERQIRVLARDFAYEPAVIRVSRGERVTFIFEAEDVTHGLYLDGYDVDLVAVPGRVSRATFVADRPGKFRLRCSKVCGTLHPFMLGELIVIPNSPFRRAIALAVLAAVGTVAYLWAGPREVTEKAPA